MYEKDLQEYQKLLERGLESQVINGFMDKYINPLSVRYESQVSNYIRQMENRILSPEQIANVSMQVSVATNEYRISLVKVFKEFTNKVFARHIFQANGVTSPMLKNTIREQTLKLFMERTAGALTGTNSMVLSAIRKYQKDMIIGNLRMQHLVDTGQLLKKDIIKFKTKLAKEVKRMNPELFNQLMEGKLIRSRPLKTGGYAHYTLENYTDMSVRTTLLNVDRTAVEVMASKRGLRVVEYYLRDHRKLKTGVERVICKYILSRKLYGKSIVALDQTAANVLQIQTLDRIKEQGAMGPYCRHSIKELPASYMAKINRALQVFEAAERVA